jgi:hypothetical protein
MYWPLMCDCSQCRSQDCRLTRAPRAVVQTSTCRTSHWNRPKVLAGGRSFGREHWVAVRRDLLSSSFVHELDHVEWKADWRILLFPRTQQGKADSALAQAALRNAASQDLPCPLPDAQSPARESGGGWRLLNVVADPPLAEAEALRRDQA